MSPVSNDIAQFDTTAEVEIPKEPLRRVIGQDTAIEIANICATQHRHLLLVGPPGIGKSMIAQAMSFYLPLPSEEIQVIHNPENPERPFVEIRTKHEIEEEIRYKKDVDGNLLEPVEVPGHVAEQLGYLCPNCNTYSPASQQICPNCDSAKVPKIKAGSGSDPFSDISQMMGGIIVSFNQQMSGGRNRIQTTEGVGGKEEVVVYERAGEHIRKLNEHNLERRRKLVGIRQKKVLVPLKRNPFVLSTGASETELLGDVGHDPYGGHPKIGTPPYQRVVPGSIHEAHQGVLFIDELPHLGHLQRYILTAMQEKRFPITGRNPQSAGASVKVENVPCDFIFVGACNIQDVPTILSPLRSRILGSGYEVLLDTTMEDSPENRNRMIQFVAQEINMDKKIPHATRESVIELIRESRRRAQQLDGKKHALTLRLRELGGIIRVAGDLATMTQLELIEKKHIQYAIKRCKTIEEQIKDKYGSFYGGVGRDISSSQRTVESYDYWERHEHDDRQGYH